MRSSRLTVAFLLAVATGAGAAVLACSDSDPRYGTPEAIRGRKIDYGDNAAPATETDAATGTGVKTAPEAFADLYPTFAASAGDGTKCTPCHAAGGTGGKFFVATDAASSRAFFLANGYQDITKPNSFATKGQHTGNALTKEQLALTKKWADAEKAAGTMTPAPDAGTGAGTGTDAGDGG
jgi:hypothetical protein